MGAADNTDNVQSLLLKAEQQMKAGRLTKPPGDNAYETYREVLRLDARNPTAKAGVAKIIAHFEQQAQQRQDEPATQVMQVASPAPQSAPAAPAAPTTEGRGTSFWMMILGAIVLILLAGIGFLWFFPAGG